MAGETEPKRGPVDTSVPTRVTPPGLQDTGPVEIGETLGGRYLVIEALGHGGFGWVYRVKDLQLDREVALKLLHPSYADALRKTGLAQALIAEAKAAARLEHPNIVPVYDAGEIDGTPFLTMGLVRGPTLTEILEDQGPWDLQRALAVVRPICDGLDHAHRHGIIHRDIKPSNILLEEDGRPLLVDFGIAQIRRGPAGDRKGPITGTPGYTAPEVMQGAPAGPRSDLFAVGAILYEMLAGERAFQGRTTREVVESVLNQEPPSLKSHRKGIPRGVGKVLSRALAKRPEDRYPDGASIAAALARVLRVRAVLRTGAVAVLVLVAAAAAWGVVHMARPLDVQAHVRGETRTAGQDYVPVAVGEETVLRAGDRFWIAGLEVSRDAHVCVLFLDSSGRLQRIVPDEDGPSATLLEGRETYRFPPKDGKWILDRRAGIETLFVVASRKEVPAGEIQALMDRANQEAERLAAKAPGRLRGIKGVTTAPTVRREQEAEIEEILRERFPVVRRYAFRHM